MLLLPSIYVLLCSLIIPKAAAAHRNQNRRFRHEAVEAFHKRLIEENLVTPVPIAAKPTPASKKVYTIITPSPGAPVVEVTKQSQVVKTFVPVMTMCLGPPIGLVPITTAGPPYQNFSAAYATTVAGNGSCSTYYRATSTTVCATTLTGIARRVTISKCDQQVTFSSDYDYSLVLPSPTTNGTAVVVPTPSVVTKITYHLAPWQALLVGDTPNEVGSKVCTVKANDTLECIHYEEVWEVQPSTIRTTRTSHVDLTTTVTGPGRFMIETLHLDITQTETIVTVSTKMLLASDMEVETIIKSTKTASTKPPDTTIYITKPVKHAPTKNSATTTVHETRITTVVLTTTLTRPRSRLPSS
ncbi:hypothetical protein BU16DRAFT_220799 [Lophium mytilinum]|uniref:Uncharacterized protein n=1 Tax=Lophium mytilinum TaxID=390894 RepID=A0A6A6QAI7_9PEZI|nr:hypothetical protein BU16DRAFT_220799 [Lophium mytilinum]